MNVYNSLTQPESGAKEQAIAQYNASKSLALQKKSEYTDPLSMIGAELAQSGLGGTAKRLAKRTGFKSLEGLGDNVSKYGVKEGLKRTLVNLQKEGIKKGTSLLDTQTDMATKLLNRVGVPGGLNDADTDFLKNGGKISDMLNNKLTNLSKSYRGGTPSLPSADADPVSTLVDTADTGVGRDLTASQLQGLVDRTGGQDAARSLFSTLSNTPLKPATSQFATRTADALTPDSSQTGWLRQLASRGDDILKNPSSFQGSVSSPYGTYNPGGSAPKIDPATPDVSVPKINPADVSTAPDATSATGGYSRGALQIDAKVPLKQGPDPVADPVADAGKKPLFDLQDLRDSTKRDAGNPFGAVDPNKPDPAGWKAERLRRAKNIQQGVDDIKNDPVKTAAYEDLDRVDVPDYLGTGVSGPARIDAIRANFETRENFLNIAPDKGLNPASEPDGTPPKSTIDTSPKVPDPTPDIQPAPKADPTPTTPDPDPTPDVSVPKPTASSLDAIAGTSDESNVATILKTATIDSTVADDNPLGDVVTGLLGVGALIAPMFIHENSNPLQKTITTSYQEGATAAG